MPVHAGTWSLVQHPNKTTCASSPCAITVTSTTAGNLLIGIAGFSTNTGAMTSITGGTSVHPSCKSTSGSFVSNIAYVLSATGGTTSVSFTYSGTDDWIEFLEYKSLGGTPTFDVCGVRSDTSSGANIAGVSAGTLSGTNDVIVQFGEWQNLGATVCTNSSASPNDFPNSNSVCGLINSTNTAAGTYSNASGNSNVALGSVAFKDTGGGVACTPRLMLTHAGGPC
jgi:hypothetical protein